MGLFFQITARVIPAAAMVGAGFWGWHHWQQPAAKEDQKTSQSIKNQQRGNKQPKGKRGKTAVKPRIKGLKTKFLPFETTDYQVQLRTQGIVQAPEVTAITSQVAGRIINLGENFVTGAFVKKGEILAQVDPTDFDSTIISAEASVAQAKADLAQEKARGEQALRNWKDIGFEEAPNDLVLRKPQLLEAEAKVRSAEAALSKAIRNKERCTVTAPFSGVIRSRLIGNGSVIGGSTKLGEVLSTDFAEVRLPLSQNQLDTLEQGGERYPTVNFTSALQRHSDKSWVGKITRKEGEMDLSSRELYLIARIEDPFSLKQTHSKPLTFNQPVLATIPAKMIEDVYLVAREHVQGLRDIITVNDKNRIKRIKLDPLWEDDKQLVISADSIPKGSVLATSRLDYAVDGAKVTLIDKEGNPVDPKALKKSGKPPLLPTAVVD